jgi:hypothetical protein
LYTIFETVIGIVKNNGKFAFAVVPGNWSAVKENDRLVAGTSIARWLQTYAPSGQKIRLNPECSLRENSRQTRGR